jgi:2-amino-4-hydroxy-6-hydroxymethyldihydropteridine diphosphokinase
VTPWLILTNDVIDTGWGDFPVFSIEQIRLNFNVNHLQQAGYLEYNPPMPHIVYIALGTNLGERLANLRAATDAMAPDVDVLAQSYIYETPPWGYEDQPAFLNMVVKAETGLEPESLLKYLKQIEIELGREKSVRWGPRLIDLDILFYDDLVLDTPPLVIPHPRLHERAFVLVPLADVAAEVVHPILGEFVWELLLKADMSGIEPLSAL